MVLRAQPSLSLEKHGCLSKDSRLGRRARTLPSNSTSIRRIVLAVDENWRQLTRAKRIYSWEFCRHRISSGVLHDLSTLRCLFYLWYRHDAGYEAATVRVCCGCPCSCCNSHDSSRKPKNDGIFDGKILEKLPLPQPPPLSCTTTSLFTFTPLSLLLLFCRQL